MRQVGALGNVDIGMEYRWAATWGAEMAKILLAEYAYRTN